MESTAITQLHSGAVAHPLRASMFTLPATTISNSAHVLQIISERTNYDSFYKLLHDLLNFPPTSGTFWDIVNFCAHSLLDSVVDDHFFYSVWGFLHQLPPSSQFLHSLGDSKLLSISNSILLNIYWLIALASEKNGMQIYRKLRDVS